MGKAVFKWIRLSSILARGKIRGQRKRQSSITPPRNKGSQEKVDRRDGSSVARIDQGAVGAIRPKTGQSPTGWRRKERGSDGLVEKKEKPADKNRAFR